MKSLALASLVVMGLAACSDDTTETPNPTPEGENEVRAVIGAEGGELVGKEGTDLEGVKLVIPAGALSDDVEVWLRSTFDGEPLPELSERVGLQVEVGSDGALEKAATLTLPFDAGAVARFGDAGDDVKVWVRGADSWSLVEADSTTDSDVTISLEAFTTAAAGVKVIGSAAICDATCDASAAAHFDAATCGATSACITSIVSPRLVETFDFAVSSKGQLGFLTVSGTDVIAVSHNTADNTTVTTPALSSTTSVRLGGGYAGAGYIVGMGSAGNAVFSSTAKPKLVDVGSGLGSVTTKSGVTLRMSRGADGNLKAVNNSTGKTLIIPPLPIPSNANIASIGFIFSPRDPQSIMVIAVDHLTELKLDSAGTELTQTAQVTLPTALQGAGSIQVAGGDSIMVIAVLMGSTLGISRDAKTFDLVSLPFSPSSVSVNGAGSVLVGAAKSPELVLIDAANGQHGIRLSDAATTSSEFTGRIPRAIRATSDGFAVLTQDRNFLMIGLP